MRVLLGPGPGTLPIAGALVPALLLALLASPVAVQDRLPAREVVDTSPAANFSNEAGHGAVVLRLGFYHNDDSGVLKKKVKELTDGAGADVICARLQLRHVCALHSFQCQLRRVIYTLPDLFSRRKR